MVIKQLIILCPDWRRGRQVLTRKSVSSPSLGPRYCQYSAQDITETVFYSEHNKDKTQQLAQHPGQGQHTISERGIFLFLSSKPGQWLIQKPIK